MHAECEAELLDDGSRQEAIWGANWNPFTQDIVYESLINIRPRQNRSMEVLDARVREQVAQVIQQLVGGLADNERQGCSRQDKASRTVLTG